MSLAEHNVWAILRDAVPDDEALVAAVASDLGEPLDVVRPTVTIATLVRRVDASLERLRAVVDGERARARIVPPVRRTPGSVRIRADTMDGLLEESGASCATAASTWTRRSRSSAPPAGSRRGTGSATCCSSARLAVIRRVVWDACVDRMHAGRLEPQALAEMGRWIFLWTEVPSSS